LKNRTLQELRSKIYEYVSGESLSEHLGVSRTSVWKYVKELKGEGYAIESSSKKGYKLVSVPDLNAYEIAHGLKTEILGRKVFFFNSIDSTNNYAKTIAIKGCDEGTTVVAEVQTSGRGRLGREWSSVSGKGIWMSIVLKPVIGPESIQIITLAAAVAVVKAIKNATGIETGIKWPNDIILDGKKLCGILTEMSAEIERVNYIILGIGINVNHEGDDFSQSLKHIATSLKMHINNTDNLVKEQKSVDFRRSEIIKCVLFELEQMYNKINSGMNDVILDEWKNYSVTLGKEVKVIGKSEYIGIAENITQEGRLIVRRIDGVKEEVLSGEISIRELMGEGKKAES